MATIAHRLEESYPETNKNRSARVMSLQEFMIQYANDRPAMLLLMSAVVFVLLIACTNIANLVMARNSTRRRELVIRAAVGAGRWRLVRQLLVESLLIGAAGGGIGFLLATWGTALLRSSLTWNDYVQLMASEIVLDWPVFVFCTLISILAAIFFGLLPAIQASKVGLSAGLAEGARGGSGGVERRRLRRALVVGEIALSIILLTGAGVMIQAVVVEMRNRAGIQSPTCSHRGDSGFRRQVRGAKGTGRVLSKDCTGRATTFPAWSGQRWPTLFLLPLLPAAWVFVWRGRPSFPRIWS